MFADDDDDEHSHNVDNSICLQELAQVRVQDRRDDRPSDKYHTELFRRPVGTLRSSPGGPSNHQSHHTHTHSVVTNQSTQPTLKLELKM